MLSQARPHPGARTVACQTVTDRQGTVEHFGDRRTDYPGTASWSEGATVQIDRFVDRLEVSWENAGAGQAPYVWFRDNCLCPACRHPQAWERTLDTVALDPDLRPAAVESSVDLTLVWDDGHRTTFTSDWLREHLPTPAPGAASGEPEPVLWTGADARRAPADVDFPDIMQGDAGLLRLLRLIRDRGFAFVRNVPARAGAVVVLAERIAFVQETNFGRSFSVVSKPDPENLAFTAGRLTPHTDVPNRRALPGLQFLHCIDFRARGGDSILIDGYLAASRLRHADPEAHDLLTSVPIPYRFSDEGHDIINRSPVIGVDDAGRHTEIRFHPALMAPLDLAPDLIRPYYRALSAFGRIVRDPDLAFVFRMQPGDCQMFDNRRVLHAREEFDPNSGPRHLEGCYVDRDDFLSRLRVLERRGADFRR